MGKKRERSEDHANNHVNTDESLIRTNKVTTTPTPPSHSSSSSSSSTNVKSKPKKIKNKRQDSSSSNSSSSSSSSTLIAEPGLLKSFTPNNPTLSDRLNHTHPSYDKKLKELFTSLPKKERQKIIQADKDALIERNKIVTAALPSEYAFPVSEEDHCETGMDAFKDISSVLTIFNKVVLDRPSTSLGDLHIYDPYYCTGSSQRHLNTLGFNNVYHKNEDFYQQVYGKTIPNYDILLTNPAYSNDHIPRLVHILSNNLVNKPFLLLMPCFVLNKDYWKKASEKYECFRECIYFYPLKRYTYWTPKGLRNKTQTHSSVAGNRTSPYVSMWFAHFGDKHKEMIEKLCNNKYQRSIPNSNLRIALKITDLPPVMQPNATALTTTTSSSSTTVNNSGYDKTQSSGKPYNDKYTSKPKYSNNNSYTDNGTTLSSTVAAITAAPANKNHLVFHDEEDD